MLRMRGELHELSQAIDDLSARMGGPEREPGREPPPRR
jgi:hypothetical protein